MQAQSYQHPAVRDLINRYVRIYQNDYVIGPDLKPAPQIEVRLKASISLEQIVLEVAEEFAVTVLELVSHRRTGFIAAARQAYFWLARELTGHSFPAMARYLGNRNHTTAMHGVEACARRMEEDPDYKFMVLAARRRLEGRA